jgi:hypothetical protein
LNEFPEAAFNRPYGTNSLLNAYPALKCRAIFMASLKGL